MLTSGSVGGERNGAVGYIDSSTANFRLFKQFFHTDSSLSKLFRY